MGPMTLLLALLLAAITLGGTVFYALNIAAVRGLRRRQSQSAPHLRAAILKPLSGLEPGLEANLHSFTQIRYPDAEILFGVSSAEDPACAVARRQIESAQLIPSRLITTGEPDTQMFPNPKVANLAGLAAETQADVLVISDSDIRATPDYLDGVLSPFADAQVGVVTCPYRGVGESLWSELEAVGMDTEFWGGVFVAQMLGPMDFAVGPTMAVRRRCLEDIGGFEALGRYLAEDFIIGRDAAAKGWKVVLAKHVVEHRIGGQAFLANIKHRLRWYRSTRRSRPAGYVLQGFTYPLPFAFALIALTGGAWWTWALAAACAALRGAAAHATAAFLGHPRNTRFWALLPVQDVLSFLVWLGAFFGDRIVWRGREFRVTADGKLEPV